MRICVVIPAFDNPRTISRVAREVVLALPYPLLILDDASETPVLTSLYSFEVREAMERGRVRVIRFDKRQGTGGATAYAIRDLAAAGFTHMLTLDGDGRHDPRELVKLITEGLRHPWDLIVGRRDLPPSRPRTWWARAVAKVMEYCVRFEAGQRLDDPRSGFRMYPLLPVQLMKFRTRHADFGLEILIRALWRGVHVREVTVGVKTLDPADVLPTTNRWAERLRLSFLNTVLITVKLLSTRSSPTQLAAAMGVGVFVGCSPLLGFHAGMAVAFAALFRLNIVAVLVGSRVSTAPLLPFLYYASVYIGEHWLHVPEAAGRIVSLYRWAAGAVVLGVVLGFAAALVTYFVARATENPRPVDEPPASGARVLAWLARRGGRSAVRAWTCALAGYNVLMSPRVRRGLREFYRVTAPRMNAFDRVRAYFAHARAVMDLAADHALPSVPGRVEGPLGDAVVTAHLGSWSNAARAAGVDTSRPVDYPDRPGAAGAIEIIPFFGHLAAFDVASFARASREHVRLATAFAVREGEEYVIHARDPRRLTPRDDVAEEVQIYEWASRFVVQLEFMVKKHPTQWTALYRFWSTIPRFARVNGEVGRPIETLTSPVTRPR